MSNMPTNAEAVSAAASGTDVAEVASVQQVPQAAAPPTQAPGNPAPAAYFADLDAYFADAAANEDSAMEVDDEPIPFDDTEDMEQDDDEASLQAETPETSAEAAVRQLHAAVATKSKKMTRVNSPLIKKKVLKKMKKLTPPPETSDPEASSSSFKEPSWAEQQLLRRPSPQAPPALEVSAAQEEELMEVDEQSIPFDSTGDLQLEDSVVSTPPPTPETSAEAAVRELHEAVTTKAKVMTRVNSPLIKKKVLKKLKKLTPPPETSDPEASSSSFKEPSWAEQQLLRRPSPQAPPVEDSANSDVTSAAQEEVPMNVDEQSIPFDSTGDLEQPEDSTFSTAPPTPEASAETSWHEQQAYRTLSQPAEAQIGSSSTEPVPSKRVRLSPQGPNPEVPESLEPMDVNPEEEEEGNKTDSNASSRSARKRQRSDEPITSSPRRPHAVPRHRFELRRIVPYSASPSRSPSPQSSEAASAPSFDPMSPLSSRASSPAPSLQLSIAASDPAERFCNACGRNCGCPRMPIPPQVPEPLDPEFADPEPAANAPEPAAPAPEVPAPAPQVAAPAPQPAVPAAPRPRRPRKKQSDPEFGRLQDIKDLKGASLPAPPPVVARTKNGRLYTFQGAALGAERQIKVVESDGFEAGNGFQAALYLPGIVALLGRIPGAARGSALLRDAEKQVQILYHNPEDPIVELAAGSSHILMRSEAGHLFAVGRSQEGQLGIVNPGSYRQAKVTPDTMRRVIKDANGKDVEFAALEVEGNHNLVTAKNGDVYQCGQLDDEPKIDLFTLVVQG